MTLEQRIDALSDEFQSTFSLVRTDPVVLANMMAPSEVPHVESLIKKHLGWESVKSVSTGQLSPQYDIYYFSASNKSTEPYTGAASSLSLSTTQYTDSLYAS